MKQPPLPRQWPGAGLSPCALRGPICQCWAKGSHGSVVSLEGVQEDSRGSSPDRVPRYRCQDRGVATLGQSVQSPFSQEIKKIYTTWVASRAGPRQFPVPRHWLPSVQGAVGSRGSHPGPSKSRILGAGDLGSVEQQGQRHWWGPHGPG